RLSESTRQFSDGRPDHTRPTNRLLLFLLAGNRDPGGGHGANCRAVPGSDLWPAPAANHAAGFPAAVSDVALPDSGAGGRGGGAVRAGGAVAVPADRAGGAGGRHRDRSDVAMGGEGGGSSGGVDVALTGAVGPNPSPLRERGYQPHDIELALDPR